MNHQALVLLFAVCMLPGLFGVLVPVLPGIPLMLLVAIVFGFVDGFEHLSGTEISILAVLAAVSVAVDYFSGSLGARYGGASARSAGIGILGFLIGSLLLPPFGGAIGMVLAIVGSELTLHKDGKRALRAAGGSLLGTVLGIMTNLLLAAAFLFMFIRFAL
ncbi:MAG: hypothetical protein K0S20_712 [Patescibacteria group bacterium]|nr:hypothetical protein [Patescibacteria group bacterium]